MRRGVGATRHPLEVKSQVRILPARQKLFFMNEIINCRFEENCLPDHCADLIIADPPYFQYKGDFDFVWPTFDDYLNNVRRWGEECRRLLKDNGTLIWWGSDKRIAYTQVILDTMFLFLKAAHGISRTVGEKYKTQQYRVNSFLMQNDSYFMSRGLRFGKVRLGKCCVYSNTNRGCAGHGA